MEDQRSIRDRTGSPKNLRKNPQTIESPSDPHANCRSGGGESKRLTEIKLFMVFPTTEKPNVYRPQCYSQVGGKA